MELQNNTKYDSEVFNLITRNKIFYSTRLACNFYEDVDIGRLNCKLPIYQIRVPDKTHVQYYEQIVNDVVIRTYICSSIPEQLAEINICEILTNLSNNNKLEEVLDKYHNLFEFIPENLAHYEMCEKFVKLNPLNINNVKNNVFRDKLIDKYLERELSFFYLNQEYITEKLIRDFLTRTNNVNFVIKKIMSLKNIVNMELLKLILSYMQYCHQFTPLLDSCIKFNTDNFSLEDVWAMIVDRYYYLFTIRDKKSNEWKYNKVIHLRLIGGSIPETCILKLAMINKFYLVGVKISYDIQKELIRMKPNLFKYITNVNKDLVIFAIKRCFKLIYYVSNIDTEIFNEFSKSHSKHKITKFYFWCKDFNYEIPTGRFARFDFKGFIREFENVCPEYSIKKTTEIPHKQKVINHEESDQKQMLLKNPQYFEKIINPSEEICLLAVSLDKNNIKHVKHITNAIYYAYFK
jgi:hypothetical protein